MTRFLLLFASFVSVRFRSFPMFPAFTARRFVSLRVMLLQFTRVVSVFKPTDIIHNIKVRADTLRCRSNAACLLLTS